MNPQDSGADLKMARLKGLIILAVVISIIVVLRFYAYTTLYFRPQTADRPISRPLTGNFGGDASRWNADNGGAAIDAAKPLNNAAESDNPSPNHESWGPPPPGFGGYGVVSAIRGYPGRAGGTRFGNITSNGGFGGRVPPGGFGGGNGVPGGGFGGDAPSGNNTPRNPSFGREGTNGFGESNNPNASNGNMDSNAGEETAQSNNTFGKGGFGNGFGTSGNPRLGTGVNGGWGGRAGRDGNPPPGSFGGGGNPPPGSFSGGGAANGDGAQNVPGGAQNDNANPSGNTGNG